MHAINFFEIPVADMNRARTFYEDLFAVSLRMEENNTLAIFPYGKGGVGGGLKAGIGAPSPQGVLPYLNADSQLDAMLGKLTRQGATILVPKTEIAPEIGHIAIFIDCEGNRIGLHAEPQAA